MVKRSEAFPSKYLKTDDLNGEAVVATIKTASMETMKGFDGKEQQKVVVYFGRLLKPISPVHRLYTKVYRLLRPYVMWRVARRDRKSVV